MEIRGEHRLETRHELRLILKPDVLLSLDVLLLPVEELRELVESELEKNIFLEELPIITGSVLFEREEDERFWFENIPAKKDWKEEVIEEIEGLRNVDEKYVEIMKEIVLHYVDDKGFLNESLEVIAEVLGCNLTDVESARNLLMKSVEPEGIGSTSFEEYLSLQLSLMGFSTMPLNEAVEVVLKRGYKIKPYPLYGWDTEDTRYVYPEAYVVRVGDDFQVIIDEKLIPSLGIREEYREIIMDPTTDEETLRFLKESLERARNLIKAIEQRKRTVRKTVEAIIELERDFFEKGPEYIKPINLSDVAEKVGYHVSTISRVITNKYVHTPWGTVPLKVFFEDKGYLVKKRVKEIIECENPCSPLSDAKIAEILRTEGLNVARRTVTKYREELGIPSSRERRNKDANSHNR